MASVDRSVTVSRSSSTRSSIIRRSPPGCPRNGADGRSQAQEGSGSITQNSATHTNPPAAQPGLRMIQIAMLRTPRRSSSALRRVQADGALRVRTLVTTGGRQGARRWRCSVRRPSPPTHVPAHPYLRCRRRYVRSGVAPPLSRHGEDEMGDAGSRTDVQSECAHFTITLVKDLLAHSTFATASPTRSVN